MQIVIIGSGMAGIQLAEALKREQPEAAVQLITRETRGYYSRPMLSHGFSRSDVEEKIILKSFDQLRSLGIDLRSGQEVTHIDRAACQLGVRESEATAALPYERLVLAPGSDALVPPPLQGARSLFHTLNSLDDLLELRRLRAALLARGIQPHWGVIGGGLIGCEVGSDLIRAGDSVTLYHAMPRLMERQLAEEDSAELLAQLTQQGMRVRLNAAVSGLVEQAERRGVRLDETLEGGFDGVIVACGFRPRTELARAAGLAVGRGIHVDGWLRSSDPQIFALGDAAEFQAGHLYPYVMPIRQQALWLARHLVAPEAEPWKPPTFQPRAKIHGFTARHPYHL